MADCDGGLRVIDIGGPGSPIEVASVATPEYAFDVAIVGDHAFVSANDSGVRVIDISVPTAPSEVGFSNPAPMQARSIVVLGDQAYVGNRDFGLLVRDISTPSAPVEAGFCDTIGSVSGVAADDGIIIATDHNALVAVFEGCNDILFDDGFEVLGTTTWTATLL